MAGRQELKLPGGIVQDFHPISQSIGSVEFLNTLSRVNIPAPDACRFLFSKIVVTGFQP